MKIMPGLYQIKIPIPDNPLGYVNTYLIPGDKGCLLVDAGWNTPEALEAMEHQLSEIGYCIKDITSIVVTHIHPDHYGLAGRLKQDSHASLAIHYIEKAFIETRYIDFKKLVEDVGQWLHAHGVPDPVIPNLKEASISAINFVSPAMPDTALHGGERITYGDFNFKVLWTPGHSPGHVCLYDKKKKVLLAGDHILPVITPNVSLHVQSMGNPLADYINSLKEIRQLEIDIVLPAHEYIFNDARKRIDEIINHHHEREEVILDTIRDEPGTAYHIASVIPWETMGVGWDGLSPLDQRSAVMETLAHLEFLKTEERAEIVHVNDLILYRAL